MTLATQDISCELILEPEDHRALANLSGELNNNIHLIEKELGVEINNRGCYFNIIGIPDSINHSSRILHHLYQQAQEGMITTETVRLIIKETMIENNEAGDKKQALDASVIKTQIAHIKARTLNQLHYINSIRKHDINFGIGPSGTGKTFLAVACACEALESQQVQRLILVRPAVEAGEKLGFLPGDLQDKIDPYLRPLYDALYLMLGADKVHKLIEQNIIEVAPLAYMRGRTLNDAYIILDESQNTTPEQMKMFLTRIGFGSKTIITGDVTQVDLPKHIQSGLRHATEILQSTNLIQFTFFKSKDVVRHPVVQKIIEAYERYDDQH